MSPIYITWPHFIVPLSSYIYINLLSQFRWAQYQLRFGLRRRRRRRRRHTRPVLIGRLLLVRGLRLQWMRWRALLAVFRSGAMGLANGTTAAATLDLMERMMIVCRFVTVDTRTAGAECDGGGGHRWRRGRARWVGRAVLLLLRGQLLHEQLVLLDLLVVPRNRRVRIVVAVGRRHVDQRRR